MDEPLTVYEMEARMLSVEDDPATPRAPSKRVVYVLQSAWVMSGILLAAAALFGLFLTSWHLPS